MRPDLTPIWRVGNAALCSCELSEFWVSVGEHRQALLVPHLYFASCHDAINYLGTCIPQQILACMGRDSAPGTLPEAFIEEFAGLLVLRSRGGGR
jgi:hypothetical protein